MSARRKVQPKASGTPRPLLLLISGVLLLGGASLAARASDMGRLSGRDFLVMGGLAVAIALIEQFPVALRYKTETLYFTLTDGLWAGALFFVPPDVLALGIAVGVLLGQLRLRRPLRKVAFNVGQYLIGLALAERVFLALNPQGVHAPAAWLAAATAMASYAVVSATLVALAISLAERRPVMSILLPPLRANAMHYAGNIAIGILGALAWSVSPAGLSLVILPLILYYVSYGALIQRLGAGDRVRDRILASAYDGIFVVSTSGAIQTWNRGMERITGVRADDVLDQLWEDVLGCPFVQNEAQGTGASTMGLWEEDALIHTREGRRWIRYTRSPVLDDRGKVAAYVVVARDVTAQRDADRLKTDLTSMLAGQLRIPLTPLRQFLQSLHSGTVADESPEARRSYYQMMLRQAERVESLTAQLQEAAGIQSGQSLLQNEPIELSSFMTDQVWRASEIFAGRRIEFEDVEDQIFVSADARGLGLIMTGLLSHAVMSSLPDKPVRISSTHRGGRALVSLSFVPERRSADTADNPVARDEGIVSGIDSGTGAELFMAKRLIEGMSGQLSLSTGPGPGSTILLSLPAMPSATLGSARNAERTDEFVRELREISMPAVGPESGVQGQVAAFEELRALAG